MFKLFSNVINSFEPIIKKKFYFVIFLVFFSAILEVFSIGLVLPLISSLLMDTQNYQVFPFIEKLFEYLPDGINYVIFFTILIFLVFIFKNIFLSLVLIYQHNFLYEDIHNKMSNNLLSNYLKIDYLKILKSNSSYFLRNIIENTSTFAHAVVTNIIALATEIFLISIFFIFLLIVEFKATLITSALILFFTICYIFLFSKKLSSLGKIKNEKSAQRIKDLRHIFDGIKVVKIYGLESFFKKKFISNSSITIINAKLERIFSGLSRFFLEILALLSVTLMIAIMFFYNYSGYQILTVLGIYTASAFKIIPSVNRLIIALNTLKFNTNLTNSLLQDYKNSSLSIKKDFLEKKLEKEKFTSLKFKNLNFSYEDNKYVFKNLNFELKKNDFISVIGESGSGKSTLIDLISGLLIPSSGEVLLNDKKIFLDEYNLINNIAYVPQSTYLFDDTIASNIAFEKLENIKNDEIKQDKIYQICKSLELGSLINYEKKGIFKQVGEMGTSISGGQKQRIGIARALYKNSEILIFDESTNSLDKKTEDEILSLILNLKNQKTVVFITHNNNISKIFYKKYKIAKNTIELI